MENEKLVPKLDPATVLNECQMRALKKALIWFTLSDGSKPYFRLTGYAGCGKTFMCKFLIDQFGLNEDEVVYAAFTGSAAMNLVKKGNKNATTIHKLIYNSTVEEVRISYDPPKFDENLNEIYQKCYKKIITVLKDRLDNPNIKLIIIDEFSMVSKKMINDILSFGRKVLFLGDPGQLPPIKDENEINRENDIVKNYDEFINGYDSMLDQIVRQKDDSPIIDLSFKSRNKEAITFGSMNSESSNTIVNILPYEILKADEEFAIDIYNSSDQIICGFNRTRKNINNIVRRVRGYDNTEITLDTDGYEITIPDTFPKVGEKLICINNNWEIGVYSQKLNSMVNMTNGSIWYVKGINFIDNSHKIFGVILSPDFDNEIELDVVIDFYNFSPLSKYPISMAGNRHETISVTKISKNLETNLDIFSSIRVSKSSICQFDFGYCITCHKSQGNQFKNLTVIVEPVMTGKKTAEGYLIDDPDLDKKWLYTAITRAEDNLNLFIPKSYYMNKEYKKDNEFWNEWRYYYK